MTREWFEPTDDDQECDCGLPRSEHDAAPFFPFGEECQAAKIHRCLDNLRADAPSVFRGSDITVSDAGWSGEMTEPEASAAELLAEQIAAACEERDGPLPPGPAVCEVCGREPDCHIGGPILNRAAGDVCEIGTWEDRIYALLPQLAAASVLHISAVPDGFDMDSASSVDPDDVTLRLVIE